MKANELMIGDWVQCRDEFNEVTGPYEIDLISNDEIAFKGEMFARVFNNSIEPIPLTPEILEKNGFVNKKGRFMQKGNFDVPPLIMWHLVDDKILGHPKSQLEIHHGEKSMHVSLVCIYVHELQHALRLCGIEKEIEL